MDHGCNWRVTAVLVFRCCCAVATLSESGYNFSDWFVVPSNYIEGNVSAASRKSALDPRIYQIGGVSNTNANNATAIACVLRQ